VKDEEENFVIVIKKVPYLFEVLLLISSLTNRFIFWICGSSFEIHFMTQHLADMNLRQMSLLLFNQSRNFTILIPYGYASFKIQNHYQSHLVY